MVLSFLRKQETNLFSGFWTTAFAGVTSLFLIFRRNCGQLSLMINYELAKDITERIEEIIHKLGMSYLDESRIMCIRSKGSKGKRVIARCHGLSRIMQLALSQKPHYAIEVISEKFDKLGKDEQTKVLIHELMHIPHSFGGGFRHHKPYVTRRKIERIFEKFIQAK
jgi:predicted metallopeptidase